MVGTVIFSDPSKKLIVTKYHLAIPEVYELIENMIWGTKGPRFYKVNTHIKIDFSVKPDFMLLWIDKEFAGMCTISHREVWFTEKWLPTYYLQFFAIKPKFQGNAFGNVLVENVRDYYQNNTAIPVVSYAYIEGENIGSDKVAQHIEYKHAAKFKTILFGRMFPKSSVRCRKIKPEEKVGVIKQLQEFYKDYSFAHFEYVFNQDNYWVIERDNKIVAGLQAHPQHWKFVSIPGITGKFIHKILPYIPIAKKLFNAKNHQFLCYEGQFCQDGNEADIIELMEHCLSSYNRTSGMSFFDIRSPLYKSLDALKSWGLLDKIEGKHNANVYAKLHNLPEEKWGAFTNKPLYIAAYDCV